MLIIDTSRNWSSVAQNILLQLLPKGSLAIHLFKRSIPSFKRLTNHPVLKGKADLVTTITDLEKGWHIITVGSPQWEPCRVILYALSISSSSGILSRRAGFWDMLLLALWVDKTIFGSTSIICLCCLITHIHLRHIFLMMSSNLSRNALQWTLHHQLQRY